MLATAQLGVAQPATDKKCMLDICRQNFPGDQHSAEQCMKNFFKHEFSVKECPIGEYKPDRPENEQCSRGELVATVSQRQLHAAWSVVRRAMLAPRGRVGKKSEANRST